MSVTALTHLDKTHAQQVAGLIEKGMVTRGTCGVLGRASEHVRGVGADHVFPLQDELCPLLPWRGLRRGATIAVAAEKATAGSASLLMALFAEAVRTGSWCAVVGVPELGAAAAAELGVDLRRLAVVPHPGAEWMTVVAALLDGLDIVVVRPPGPVPPAMAQRITARAKQRGSVLISYGSWAGAEVTLQATRQVWHGLGAGEGRLRGRELAATSYGRGAATRPRSVRLWLPASRSSVIGVSRSDIARPEASPGAHRAGRDATSTRGAASIGLMDQAV